MEKENQIDSILKHEFLSFEDVRQSGEYNMYDPMARISAGLDKETWITIMRNYELLKQKWGEINE